MSHFTVLVVGPNPEEQLAPFQENNMDDCPKEYLTFHEIESEKREEYENEGVEKVVMPDGRFLNIWDTEFRVPGSIGIGTNTHEVPKHLEIREVSYKELYSTFEEYMEDWCSYKERDEKTGKYGYWENPDAKWDWYQLGGRWTGYFKLKSDANPEFAIQGRPGLMTEVAEVGYADTALKKDIDIAGMIAEAQAEAKDRYEKIEAIFPDGIPKLEVEWEALTDEEGEYKDWDWDKRRKFYHGQEGMVHWKEVTQTKAEKLKDVDEELRRFYIWADLSDYQLSKEDYIQDAGNGCLSSYAVIKEGKWYERGEMGWWGVASNEKSKNVWNEEFAKLIEDLPENTLLSIYDCHI